MLAVRETLAIPRQRIFNLNNGDSGLSDYLLSVLAPQLDPTLLSIITNQGASQSDLLRQLILSSVGKI